MSQLVLHQLVSRPALKWTFLGQINGTNPKPAPQYVDDAHDSSDNKKETNGTSSYGKFVRGVYTRNSPGYISHGCSTVYFSSIDDSEKSNRPEYARAISNLPKTTCYQKSFNKKFDREITSCFESRKAEPLMQPQSESKTASKWTFLGQINGTNPKPGNVASSFSANKKETDCTRYGKYVGGVYTRFPPGSKFDGSTFEYHSRSYDLKKSNRPEYTNASYKLPKMTCYQKSFNKKIDRETASCVKPRKLDQLDIPPLMQLQFLGQVTGSNPKSEIVAPDFTANNKASSKLPTLTSSQKLFNKKFDPPIIKLRLKAEQCTSNSACVSKDMSSANLMDNKMFPNDNKKDEHATLNNGKQVRRFKIRPPPLVISNSSFNNTKSTESSRAINISKHNPQPFMIGLVKDGKIVSFLDSATVEPKSTNADPVSKELAEIARTLAVKHFPTEPFFLF